MAALATRAGTYAEQLLTASNSVHQNLKPPHHPRFYLMSLNYEDPEKSKDVVAQYPEFLSDDVIYQFFDNPQLKHMRNKYGPHSATLEDFAENHKQSYGIITNKEYIALINFILNNPQLFPNTYPLVKDGVENYRKFRGSENRGDWRYDVERLIADGYIVMPNV